MYFSDLQNFDYLMIFLLLLSTYVGWKNGLICSFIAFFSWVGSAIIVFDSYEYLFSIVNEYIHSKFISGFISSVVFYIVLVIIFSLLGEKISKLTSKFAGSQTDKITGAVFGSFCGAVIACTIFWCCYMVLYTLNDQKLPNWFSKAKSYKILKIGSDSLMGVAFSEEERKKILNAIKYKSNKLEDEVKSNVDQKQKDYGFKEADSSED